MMMIRITLLNVSTIVIAAVDVVVSLDIFTPYCSPLYPKDDDYDDEKMIYKEA